MIRRDGEGRSGPEQEREHQEKCRGHGAGQRQDSQRCPHDHQETLDRDQELATIESIGEDAADDREQHIGKGVHDLHKRDQNGGVWLVDQQPLSPDCLHPGADIAHQDGQIHGAEHADAKRCPRCAGSGQGGHVWSCWCCWLRLKHSPWPGWPTGRFDA